MKKILSVLVITLFLISCKKDCDTPTPTYPIEGLWIGTYTVDNLPSQGSLYYSFIIKPNGEVLTEGKGGDGVTYYAAGTWELTDNTFTATYTSINFKGLPVQQSATATFSNTGTLTNGTWEDINNPNGPALSGKFSTFNRVN